MNLRFPGHAPLALLLLLAGCNDAAPIVPTPTDPVTLLPRFDPTLEAVPSPAERWLRFPFPADSRRLPNGSPDFSDFPNPDGNSLLAGWLAEASTVDGFSTQGLAYFAFEGAVDVSTLSAVPGDFLATGSPVFLVDVTKSSPEYGRRFPLRWHYYALDGGPDGMFVALDTLGIGPAWGFPLREGTTYALVIRDSLRAADGGRIGQPALLGGLLADAPNVPAVTPVVDQALYDELRADYAPLRVYLAEQAIDASHVVDATVFTTQTFSEELAAVAGQVHDDLPAPTMSGSFLVQSGSNAYLTENFAYSSTQTTSYDVYSGDYLAPNYQEGTVPYATSGGGFHFVAGLPEPASTETIRFVLTVPTAPPDTTLGCYPIVLYGHGTGGSRNSFRYDGTAGRLAARGMAGISIDMPLHGVRAQGMSFDVEQMSFNFYNARAFRTNFRQGAVDLVSLARFVRESLSVPAAVSHTGQTISFCPDRVGYMGHSQGGLTGAMGIPFVPEIHDFMLSGAGGGLGITLINRTDIVDFKTLLALVLGVPTFEDWGEEHPLITLIQTLAEISDPTGYAPYWNRDGRYRAPASVMMTSGQHDTQTPYRTATALALAAGMPLTTPVAIPTPEYDWLGLAAVSPPVSGNAVNATTMGLLQYVADLAITDADTHFLVFHRPEAIDASMEFLRSGLYDGTPVIRRNPGVDAR